MPAKLVHQHTIIVARVEMPIREEERAVEFLAELVGMIGMVKLYGPVAKYGPNGLSGFVIITTSHMSFHFYPENGCLHLDVYSCRPYDLSELLREVDRWWLISEADILKVIRDEGPAVEVFHYLDGDLRSGSSRLPVAGSSL